METTVTIPLNEYNRLRDASIERNALKEKAEKEKAKETEKKVSDGIFDKNHSNRFFDRAIRDIFLKNVKDQDSFISRAIATICNSDPEKIGGILISTKDKDTHFYCPPGLKQQLYIMGLPVYACDGVKEGCILAVSKY